MKERPSSRCPRRRRRHAGSAARQHLREGIDPGVHSLASLQTAEHQDVLQVAELLREAPRPGTGMRIRWDDGDRVGREPPSFGDLAGQHPGGADHPGAAPRLRALQPSPDEGSPALPARQPLVILDDEVGSGQTGDEAGAGMERVPPCSLPIAGLDDVEAAEAAQRATHRQRAGHRARPDAPVGTRCIRTPSTISVLS